MKKKINLNNGLFFLALVIFFTVETNYDWNKSQLFHWGAVALLMVAYIFKDGGVIDLKFRDYSGWMMGVLIMSVISCVFASNVGNAINMIKSLVVIFVSFFMIRNYITDEKKVQDVINAYIIAILINMVYVITKIDMAVIGEERLGVDVIEGWNANSIGLMAATAANLCIYMLMKSKMMFKCFYLVCISFLVYIFVYTGSRKAILLFLVCVIVMLFAGNPRRIVRNTILTFVILAVAYNLVMNVESIYNVLGVRLEGLFAGLSGEGEIDSSTLLRQEYIENGIMWIKENPITGYGIDGYRALNGPLTGHYTYSHNNFIEVAINWGVLGFIYYYSIYLVILKRFFGVLKNNMLAVTMFSLFLGNLFMHYGMVAYYDIWQNLLLCIGCALVNENVKDVQEVQNDKENI